MAVQTAEELVRRWYEGIRSPQAKAKYIQGVNAVTESPMAAAATTAKLDYYRRRCEESVTSGYRARRLLAVPLSRYKENAVNIGAPRIQSGADKGVPKMQAFAARFLPVYAQIKQRVRQMPSGGIDEALAKVRVSIEMLQAAAGKRAGAAGMPAFLQPGQAEMLGIPFQP